MSGPWVAPAAVEAAVRSHPAAESAAVSRKDADGLPKVAACVVLKAGTAPSPRLAGETRAWDRARLAPFVGLRWIECVLEVPKTAIGRIQRCRLRAG